MSAITQKNIVKEYSIGILKVRFDYRKTQWNLIKNLEKYMIRSTGEKKENLSSIIDETLYGKK